MCGLAGIIRNIPLRDRDRSAVREMMAELRHRGPDDRGFFANTATKHQNGIALGHRRLSIIDPDTGQEPIVDPETGIVLIYNGEIYNYRSLRDYSKRETGYPFRTKTDAEVIIPLYRQRGPSFVSELRGMYAFALWDPRKQQLHLYRDRMGQKPMFYGTDGGDLFFSSELAPLHQVNDLPFRLHRNALFRYAVLGYIPAPQTIYENVKKLSPGCFLTWQDGDVMMNRYWRVPEPGTGTFSGDSEDRRKRFLDLFSEAVELRLTADVPVGAFLSGGIDSSGIVGTMSEHVEEPVRTFSVGFDEAGYDETEYAREMAEYAGTEHHESRLTPDFLDVLPELVRHYGEPFADSSALPTYFLARETSKKVKVALSGDGGDECFGGYNRYRAMLGLHYARFMGTDYFPGRIIGPLLEQLPMPDRRMSPSRIAVRFLRALSRSPADQYLSLIDLFHEKDAAGLLRDPYQPDREKPVLDLFDAYMNGKGSPAANAAYTDLNTYLPGDLLVKVDIASMANSLEVRSPFLDHRLVEFSASVPFSEKASLFQSKMFLRDAFRTLVPERIRRRPKMGFGLPVAEWFRGDQGRDVLRMLTGSNSSVAEYFDPDGVRNLVELHRSGRENHWDHLWVLLMFELWHREFM